jgi:alkylation response protein AidB-like acyl-CoA dehydrogenase
VGGQRNDHLRQPLGEFLQPRPCHGSIAYVEGNEQQRQWAAAGVERGWQATMVLTEPDAGSDVGAGRTKAFEQPDGTWHIDGVKRFITGGDVGDTAENIFHLVLARPEGAGPGTKGLSLFYVPKYLFDPDTFELGSRTGFSLGWLQDGYQVLADVRIDFRRRRCAGRRLLGR